VGDIVVKFEVGRVAVGGKVELVGLVLKMPVDSSGCKCAIRYTSVGWNVRREINPLSYIMELPDILWKPLKDSRTVLRNRTQCLFGNRKGGYEGINCLLPSDSRTLRASLRRTSTRNDTRCLIYSQERLMDNMLDSKISNCIQTSL
jgi:hypothetical protein